MRRHYKHHIYESNPLKPKALNNRLEELDALGLPSEVRQALQEDLSEVNVSPDNAIYVLDWWRARLALLRFLEICDIERTAQQNKVYEKLFGIVQSYMNKYKITAHEMALDDEMQIDYWEELRHFIQMSGANPYFKEPWPFIHRVIADLPRHWSGDFADRVVWLGHLVKDNTELTTGRPKFSKGSPAIKLLRGAYWGDPPGQEAETLLPKGAITVIKGSHKPSWVIEFLKEAETSLEVSKFFVPKVHEPFMTFPDGKCWVIVDDQDKENEKKSMGDCASGEYSSSSMVVISLREPVMSGPKGNFFRTLLRAELVFPQQVPRDPTYEQFKTSTGVINQLREKANNKPRAKYHQYIVPLLAQDWVAHLVRPSHRPDDIFWLTDLSAENLARLKEANPKLFDARTFYEKIKDLSFPKKIEEQIIEGIEFPTSHIIQLLSEVTPQDLADYRGTPKGGIVTRSLKRRFASSAEPDPELQDLLAAAEQAVVRMGTPDIVQKFQNLGFQLSIPKIEEELQVLLAGTDVVHTPFSKLAAYSLGQKLKANVPGTESAVKLAHEVLLTLPSQDDWPVPNTMQGYLVEAGLFLNLDEILATLRNIDVKALPIPRVTYYRRGRSTTHENRRYFWNLILHSVKKLVAAGKPLGELPAIFEEMVLDPEMPYVRVGEILDLDVVEITEKQIQQLLSEKTLLPGRTLVALNSLETKLNQKTLSQPKRTLAVAHDAMLRMRNRDLIESALPWINIPVKNLIKVLQLPKVNRVVRDTAIKAIELKIKDGDKTVRSRVFSAVRDLLLRTRDKGLIRSLLSMYRGHQGQYKLFHTLVSSNLEWLTRQDNRTFFLSLISTNLPATRNGYTYHKEISKPIYRILLSVVSDNLIEDNCTFVLKLLFETGFTQESKQMAQRLLEIVLDKILEQPDKLTSHMCDWFQKMPKGWGATERRRFSNKLKLTPKLLRQFKGLFKISTDSTRYRPARRECFLDLIITIAQAMDHADRQKLRPLAIPLVKHIAKEGDTSSYSEHLTRLLNLRRLRRRRR